jgi:hypothetical protein
VIKAMLLKAASGATPAILANMKFLRQAIKSDWAINPDSVDSSNKLYLITPTRVIEANDSLKEIYDKVLKLLLAKVIKNADERGSKGSSGQTRTRLNTTLKQIAKEPGI